MNSRDNFQNPQSSSSRRRFVTAVGVVEALPRLAKADRGLLPHRLSAAISWADVQRITQRTDRTHRSVMPCPFCSGMRRHANQRKPVFALTLREPDFAIYNCAHCGESGYVHPDRQSQVIDLTERKRLREESDRREREGQRKRRTTSALKLWSERQAFSRQLMRRPICGIVAGLANGSMHSILTKVLGFHIVVPVRW